MTKGDITPQGVAVRADTLRETLDPAGADVVARLKQHAWDLAVCVQKLHEALDATESADEGEVDTGDRRRFTD